MDFSSHLGVRRVNSVWRQDESGDFKICRGEPKGPPDLVAFHNFSSERIGAAQHLAGCIQISVANGVADACAAYAFAIERNGGESMHVEIQIRPERLEKIDVALALVAKSKRAADANAVDVLKVSSECANKFFSGYLAEGFVEMNQERRVHAHGFDDAKFFADGINQRWRAFGRNDGIGMAIKGDDDGNGFVLLRVGNCLTNDLLMTEMDAIEDADADADFALAGLEFSGSANDIHPGKVLIGRRQFEKRNDAFFQRSG